MVIAMAVMATASSSERLVRRASLAICAAAILHLGMCRAGVRRHAAAGLYGDHRRLGADGQGCGVV
ncbi:MAG: hypothetical protein HOH95_12045 [Dehalococcoidia bacterium]|nr:hypothetical protein [Dehalococcoidia bacterium]